MTHCSVTHIHTHLTIHAAHNKSNIDDNNKNNNKHVANAHNATVTAATMAAISDIPAIATAHAVIVIVFYGR